jgi:hypothetical protein
LTSALKGVKWEPLEHTFQHTNQKENTMSVKSTNKKAVRATVAKTEYVLDLSKIEASIQADKAAIAAHKEARKPEAVDKGLHTLAVTMAKAEGSYDKALNQVYTAFKDYALAALPIIERMPAHLAALQDIKAVFGDARKPAAIQRVTMLNNIRKIAYGAPATRDTPAQAAQGLDVVKDALNACTSLPALKQALGAMKTEKHAAQGVAKVTASGTKAKAAIVGTAPIKADDVQIPGTRAEAIKAACRMLEFISKTFLSAGTDADLVLEVADVVEHLQAKAA